MSSYLNITNANGTFYYHRDHQGSITALSDENGQVVENFTYDNHYGAIISHTKAVETNNPYAYTGREFDTEELYYYRARYYDPTIQMFISEDPIGFASGDFNWYRYVGNSSVNKIDPSGLWCFSTTSKGNWQKDKVIREYWGPFYTKSFFFTFVTCHWNKLQDIQEKRLITTTTYCFDCKNINPCSNPLFGCDYTKRNSYNYDYRTTTEKIGEFTSIAATVGNSNAVTGDFLLGCRDPWGGKKIFTKKQPGRVSPGAPRW